MTQLKVAVVIFEPITSDLARAYRGLKTALELQTAGDDVVVMFDGSGVETLAAISDPTSTLNPLAVALTQNIIGACEFCARSHKVIDAIRDAGWPLLADNDGEASIRNLMIEGYQILSF
jgi:predicted peroxiredoxin